MPLLILLGSHALSTGRECPYFNSLMELLVIKTMRRKQRVWQNHNDLSKETFLMRLALNLGEMARLKQLKSGHASARPEIYL